MSDKFKNLHILDHPVIQDRLSFIRAKSTSSADFRQGLHEIALFMGYEVTKSLPVKDIDVETPIQSMKGQALKHGFPVIVPILRAGLGLSQAMQELLPQSPMGHIGVYRDEETKRPKEYLVRLPDLANKKVIITDPMLATGYSAKHAIDIIADKGVRAEDIILMVLVAAPEGVEVIENAYPDVKVYTAALDVQLNEKAYIVPGLGDAGDRIFNT